MQVEEEKQLHAGTEHDEVCPTLAPMRVPSRTVVTALSRSGDMSVVGGHTTVPALALGAACPWPARPAGERDTQC